MVIRDAGPGDIALCEAIYARAILEGTSPHYDAAQARAWVGEGRLDPARAGRARIAVLDGAPVGFLSADGDHLDLFFVLPEARRHGVAAALYGDALARCDLRRAHASRLLRPFLERRGWRAIARQDVERGGTVLPRWEMVR